MAAKGKNRQGACRTENVRRRPGIELILFLAVNLTVLRSDAADGAAAASATLFTPVSVERALFGAVVLDEGTVGRVGIRLLGGARLSPAASATPAMMSPSGQSVAVEPGTAAVAKPAVGKGMLGGEMVTNVTRGPVSGAGQVSVIVSYD